MLTSLSVKQLYPLALAEGEGVGTAYEYFAKRLALRRWLTSLPSPKTVLMAGLPAKYGCNLDFFLLAHEYQASLTVVDHRPEALTKAENALKNAQTEGLLTGLNPTFLCLTPLEQLPLSSLFDLAICSEVIQQFTPAGRQTYAQRLREVARLVALFCPNKDNASHVGVSGLHGLTQTELKSYFPQTDLPVSYLDMPPFPPGITRSAEQREQATSGWKEALAMWGLGYYAQLERFMPLAVRRPYAHIVYAFSQGQK